MQKISEFEDGMSQDTRLIEFRQKYWQTLQLAHGWDCSNFFNQGLRELINDLQALISLGSVTRDQVSTLATMLKAMASTQEKWLRGEAAIIEAAAAVKH